MSQFENLFYHIQTLLTDLGGPSGQVFFPWCSLVLCPSPLVLIGKMGMAS